MIRFACPGCSATFTVTDDKAGKTGKCPKCQTQFTIPAPPVEDPDRPPPPTTAEAPPPIPTVEAPPPLPIRTYDAPPPIPPPVAPPPPVVSAPAGPNDPVEIAPCPKCTSRLSVMPGDVGLDVECPNCQSVYRATTADAPPPPVLRPSGRPPSFVQYGSGVKQSRDYDDDNDDRPSRRRSRRDEDDDDDDRPSKKRRGRDDGYDRPRGKKKKRRTSGIECKKNTAGIFAILLGFLGVHKFYLGYTTAGILMLVLTLCTGLGWVIGLIEGIIYLTKSDEEFIETYQIGEKEWF